MINFLLSKLQITIFQWTIFTMKIQHLYRYPHIYQYQHPFLPFFQIEILEYWIFFLISFKKKAEIEFYVESDIKRNQFFKKRLPSIFGHSMMMMRVLMLMLVSSVMYDGAKELESAPKNTKRMKKWHLLVPSCFKDAELKKFLTFARKKVWFYVMWRA